MRNAENDLEAALPEHLLAVHYSADDRLLSYLWRTPRLEFFEEKKLESDLLSQITSLTEHLVHVQIAAEERVRGVGTSLASQLLPPKITAALAQLVSKSPSAQNVDASSADPSPFLWIVSNEGAIPWEIIRPPGCDMPLGLAARLTRWVFDRPSPRNLNFNPMALVVALRSKEIQGSAKREKGDENTPSVSEVDLLEGLADEFGWEKPPSPVETDLILEALHTDPPAALHFIGHAGRDLKSPLLSHLILSPKGGKLTVADLAGLDLSDRQPFVFLNACESAGVSVGFTGAESFATAFIRQGAAAFVGTQWKMSNNLAAPMAEAIYRTLKAGQPLGEALRGARSSVWASSKDDSTSLAYTAYGHPTASLDSQLEPAPAVRWPGKFLEIPRYEYSPIKPPGTLLRADHGIVPFHLRQQELESLMEWALDQQELGLRLYTGPGGQGKTRLALQTCEILREKGWRAGFVKSSADKTVEEALEDIFHQGGPVLAVVDYAETRRHLLAPLAELIYRRRQDGPFRIILLSRRREEWWEQLKRETHPISDVYAGPATRHLSLQPLAASLDQRTKTFSLAAKSFARELKKPRLDMPELSLEERCFDPVLMIHMYALASVEGVNIKGEDGVLDTTLAREERFWKKSLADHGLRQNILRGVRRAMCTLTLAGGTLDRSGTVEIMQHLKAFDGQSRLELEDIAGILHSVYPGDHEGRWVMPVLPDILGEHLAEKVLEEEPQEIFDIVLGSQQVDK